MKSVKYLLLLLVLLIHADLASQELVWERVPLPATFGGGCIDKEHSRFSTWIHPTGDGAIFLSAGAMALYHSTDGGATWHHSGTGIYGADVRRLVDDGRGDLVATTNRGVFTSTDGGDQWSLVFAMQDGWPFPTKQGELFVLDRQQSIYHRPPGAATWAILDANADRAYQSTRYEYAAIDSSGVLYVERFVKHKGPALLRSTDLGRSWTELEAPEGKDEWGIIQVNGRGDLFVTTDEKIWRSTDRGGSWASLPIDTEPYLRFFGVGPDAALYADHQRSTDHGATWRLIESDTSNRDRPSRVVSIDRAGRIYAVAKNGDLFRTKPVRLVISGARTSSGRTLERSLSWVRLTAPIWEKTLAHPDRLEYYKVDGPSLFTGRGSTLFAGNWKMGLYRTTDLGATWKPVTVRDGKKLVNAHRYCYYDGALYALTSTGVIYRSEDDGATWERSAEEADLGALVPMKDGSLWAIGRASMLVLEKGETEWEKRAAPGQIASPPVIDSAGVIYMRLRDRGDDMLARSTDGGASWTQQILPERVDDIELVASPRGRLYGEQRGRVYASRDRGATWEILTPARRYGDGGFAINARGSMVMANRIERYPDSAEVAGIRISHDDGVTWRSSQQVFGMREYPIASTFDDDGYLYVMTNQGAIYRSSGSTYDTSTIEVPADGMHPDGMRAAAFDVKKIERSLAYPPFLRELRQSGKAVAAVLVGEDGAVRSIEARGTAVEFEGAAIKAAEAGAYTPAMRDGKPVASWVAFVVDFGTQEQDGYEELRYKKPDETWRPEMRVVADPTGGGLWWGPGEWDRMTGNEERFIAVDSEPSWDPEELRRNTIYPLALLKQRAEGPICIQSVIGVDGRAHNPFGSSYSAPPGLNVAAVEIVRRMRFTPAAVNGVPVPSGVTIAVDFSASDTTGRGAMLDTALLKRRIEKESGVGDSALYGQLSAEIAVDRSGRGSVLWIEVSPDRFKHRLTEIVEGVAIAPAHVGSAALEDTIRLDLEILMSGTKRPTFAGTMTTSSLGEEGITSEYMRWRRQHIERAARMAEEREKSAQREPADSVADEFIWVEHVPRWDGAELARKLEYPAEARAAGVEGTVTVRIYIDKEGRASRGVVDGRGIPLLNDAALKAVSSLTFKPAIHDGKPLGVWIQVPVTFSLEGDGE